MNLKMTVTTITAAPPEETRIGHQLRSSDISALVLGQPADLSIDGNRLYIVVNHGPGGLYTVVVGHPGGYWSTALIDEGVPPLGTPSQQPSPRRVRDGIITAMENHRRARELDGHPELLPDNPNLYPHFRSEEFGGV
mgnify:CR=1 FL=1|jgi:hypothetical protein|tara:strand:- start:13626 stop:14036 length:411 start_codon:yes stop_codon:yes gene_type:complete